MPDAECAALLNRALVGRVATADGNGIPYVVPMNFVYEPADGRIFLHCAVSGHLLDNLATNPRVCFEVDEPGSVIETGDAACDTSHVYKSVICFGRADVSVDGPDKQHALELFVRKYVDQLTPERRYDPDLRMIDTTVAITIQVEKMTGKQRRP